MFVIVGGGGGVAVESGGRVMLARSAVREIVRIYGLECRLFRCLVCIEELS